MTSKSTTIDKIRAVFLTALMVVSVFGGTVAFAGSATAQNVSEADLGSEKAQPGGTVAITGSYAGNTGLYVIADKDQNGDYNEEGDTTYQIRDGAIDEEEGTFETEFEPSADLGLEDGDEVDVYVHPGEPGDTETLERKAGTLTVDGSAPTFGDTTPEDEGVVSATDKVITVPVETEDTDGDLSITVDVNNNGDINTYEINPDGPNDDGVSFDGSEVKITPGDGKVPELKDGSVDVTVTVEDEAGNQNTHNFGFEVDTSAVEATFDIDASEEAPTNDVNEQIKVDLSSEGSEIADDSVSLQITGPGEYDESFDSESSQYNADDNTFTVTPDGENVPSFDSEGTYTVTVSADDEAGNSLDGETYDFEVDTEGPSVESEDKITLDNDDITKADLTDSPSVTVTFDEPVDASEVTAEVTIDGETIETLGFEYESTDEDGNPVDKTKVTADLDLSESGYNSVTSDSAVVDVTSAQDIVGNEMANPEEDASDVTFAIDTDGPSVELGELANEGDFSGYMNIESFIASTEDEADRTIEILVGGDENAAEEITGDASHYDTTQLPDGEHILRVTVVDDSGNSDTASADFTLDNGDTVTVQEKFLPGATDAYNIPVDGQFNLADDVFSVEGDTGVTYEIDGEGFGEDEAPTFDANEYDGTVTLSAKPDDGQEVTVDVEVDSLELNNVEAAGTNEDDNNPDSVLFHVNSDELTELTATFEADDDYQAESWQYSLSEGEITSVSGSDSTYKLDVPGDLRDGQFKVSVDIVATDTQEIEPDKSTTFTVDNGAPTLDDAEVVGADSGLQTVEVQFNESVNSDLTYDDISVEDGRASAIEGSVVTIDEDKGLYEVSFDQQFQTADAPTITVAADSVTEQYDAGDNDVNDETDTGVHTISFELSEDWNVISVPAVTDDVSLDEQFDELDKGESVWAYDAEDGWTSYEPDATKNDLTALEGGQGYIVNADEPTEIDVNAENLPTSAGDDSPQVPTEQQLEEGWNLVGHYQMGAQNQDAAFDTIEDSLDQVWLGYTGDNPATIRPGAGYWVNLDESDNYGPTNFGEVGPDIFNVEVTDGPVTDGETANVRVQISPDDEPVDEVKVSSEDLSITDVALSEVDSATQGTTFEGEISVEYADGFIGAENADLTVSAHDTAGNYDSERTDDVSANQLATYDVSIVSGSTDASVDQDATATVTAEVTNTGDLDGAEQTIALNWGPTDETEDASQSVTLDSGNSQEVELTYDVPADAAAEEVTVTVSSGDDNAETTMTVNEA